MPGNDFEKQVQQKMEELHITPSEGVWAAVEKEVGKKKDRRRLLLILLPLVLLLGGAVWFFENNNKQVSGDTNNTIANTQSFPTKHPNDTTDNQQSVPGNTESATPGKNGKVKTGVSGIAADKNDKASTYSNKANSDKSIVDSKIVDSKKSTPSDKPGASSLQSAQKNHLRRYSNHQQNVAANLIQKRKKKIVTNTSKEVHTENDLDAGNTSIATTDDKKIAGEDIAVKQHDATTNPNDSSSSDKKVRVAISVSSIKTENKKDSAATVIAKNTKTKNKKNIQFGILASAGVSNNSSKGFSSLLQSANDATYALANSNGPGNVNYAKASPLKGGLAFNIGAGVKKELSHRFSVVSGITYSYFSNSLQVGDFYDSSRSVVQSGNQDKRVENFYSVSTTAGGATHKYTNRYHYVSLPIGLEMQLGSRSHFVAEGGMVISRFIASNALHFDPSGFYYKDNSLFNKTQLAFYGGIDYNFLLNKKTRLVIGPRLQYGASNTYKKSMYGSNHSLFAGIGANIFFNKK